MKKHRIVILDQPAVIGLLTLAAMNKLQSRRTSRPTFLQVSAISNFRALPLVEPTFRMVSRWVFNALTIFFFRPSDRAWYSSVAQDFCLDCSKFGFCFLVGFPDDYSKKEMRKPAINYISVCPYFHLMN